MVSGEDITRRIFALRRPASRTPLARALKSLAIAWLAARALTTAAPARATPLLALKEANNCEGCHDPGRSQRPVLERRCTLDCQGCHIDPAGGGARNQWGYYYESMWASPVRFFRADDPLKDDSRVDFHYDGRILREQIDGGGDRVFPMANEMTLRVRPFIEYLHFIYTADYFGRIGDESLRDLPKDDRRFREQYAVMVDQLPLDTYARAYRGTPMYGLRRPNHTLWIRQRLGLDEFATTDAVEVGGTPNVPFLRGSLMRGDPHAAPEDRQRGTSFHGGFRGVSLGWHVNASTWDTRSEKAAERMRALGVGLKPWKFVFTAERNWREVDQLTPGPASATWASTALKVYPSSRIDEYLGSFTGIPGMNVGAVLEELHDPDQDGLRRSIFADFHPIPFLQFEIWRRFESGTRHMVDTLGILHAYVDL